MAWRDSPVVESAEGQAQFPALAGLQPRVPPATGNAAPVSGLLKAPPPMYVCAHAHAHTLEHAHTRAHTQTRKHT